MTPIAEILDTLPEIALRNIQKKRAHLPDTTTTTEHFFGHKIPIGPIQKQEIAFARSEQIIKDWKCAKEALLETLTREGVTPLAIVPTNIFTTVLKNLEIIPLTTMTDQGIVSVNLSRIDELYSIQQMLWLRLIKTFIPNNNPVVDLVTLEQIVRGTRTDFRRNKLRKYEQEELLPAQLFKEVFHHAMRHNEALFFEPIPQELGPPFFKDLLETKYSLYSELLGSQGEVCINKSNTPLQFVNCFDHHYSVFYKTEPVSATIVFEPLPEKFQQLLIKIHTAFPHWKLLTAADPNFFTFQLADGILLEEYMRPITNWWKDFRVRTMQEYKLVDEIFSLTEPTAEHTPEKFQQRLAQTTKELGLQQYGDHISTLLSDMQAAKRDEDPIFYTNVAQKYKGQNYPMTIAWGQYGTSPNEAEAINRLQGIDHTVFLGQQSN